MNDMNSMQSALKNAARELDSLADVLCFLAENVRDKGLQVLLTELSNKANEAQIEANAALAGSETRVGGAE